MSKYTVRINGERINEARDRMAKFYNGEAVDYMPYCYYSGTPDCPNYTYEDIINNPDKCVEQTIARINAQTDAYPDTDFLPFLTLPHLGEGMVPSMFGAKQYVVKDNPPYTEGRVMKNIYELDKIPGRINPDVDGWGPKMKELIEKFRDATNGEIPVGVCDHQSPYGCATKIIENEELMYAMYDEPELVHEFLSIISQGIEDTIIRMREWVGGRENLVENYTAPVPGRCGLILWDDYISVVTPALHTEFCKPQNDRLYAKFGRGHLHTCGPYFPGYLDAAIACNPISLDTAIMTGFSRKREDMLKFRRITREHGIIVTGSIASCEGHIMGGGWDNGDEDYLREMACGGLVYNGGGKPEDGAAATAKWKQICREVM